MDFQLAFPMNEQDAASGIDALERSICTRDKELLNILLYDQTTKRNILWATSDYISFGSDFSEHSEIFPEQVVGRYANLVQPRIAKTLNTQIGRMKDKAEIFTPAWVCN